ncbi:hypothetical protein B7R22_13975 [Subtercola boreus]|uniref:DUF998 domain-containing protein n=1 Tax=Subtercola boreus TaxID=120213 RepID=A0A3E0VSW1_9MICO|nr:DUF998 domain-containing protein [Subtercola boreus]RFA13104.1 hypothetical protein B7R22_13975 [Subtercola boreus]
MTNTKPSAPVVLAIGVQRAGAVLLILAGLWYFLSEAIAASAWHSPTYSYIYGFISDLGSSEVGTRFQGRLVDSPLHDVMNQAFIVHGVLYIIVAAILFRIIPGRARFTVLAFALVHSVGITMVGLFHESPAALTNGVIVLHSLGAASAIIGGNATAITVGLVWKRLLAPRWFGIAVTTVGVIGILSFILLQIIGTPPAIPIGGLVERGAVDTIMIAEMIVGVGLLIRLGRRSTRASLPVGQPHGRVTTENRSSLRGKP